MLVEARAGFPTGMDGHVSCPARASIALIRVSRKSLCEIFFPPHEDKKDVTIDNGLVQEVEKELFCPLPFSTGHIVIGHLICIVSMPHVTVIICHSCWLYCVPVFILIIAFSGWIVNVCQEAHISLVLLQHSCQVTPGPYSNVTTFQSQCVGFWGPWASPFYATSLSHNRKFFLCQVISQVREGKEVVHVQFMAKSF